MHSLIKKSHAVVNTWEGQETKELRHIRSSKPAYKMNGYQRLMHQRQLELMEKTQGHAKASVDCGLPKDAWHYRQVLEKSRKRSIESKSNINSGAYQRNWSSQMQEEGSR